MSVGKRIYLKRNLPDPAIVEEFKNIPASNTADVMGRSCAMNPRIHLVSSPKHQMMAGPAFTVKCRAGDNLALHAALNYCNEGEYTHFWSSSEANIYNAYLLSMADYDDAVSLYYDYKVYGLSVRCVKDE